MADRYTLIHSGISGDRIVYDEKAEGGPKAIAAIYDVDNAERIVALLNEDWEADQPVGTPEQQRALIYKQLTTRHRIALIALLEGASDARSLGIEYPASIVSSLRGMDLTDFEMDTGRIVLTEFGRRIAEGVLKRRPKKGFTL